MVLFARAKRNGTEIPKNNQEELLVFLKKLRQLESRLWGVTINELANGEEIVLEDTNHLIYLLTHQKHNELKAVLRLQEVRDFKKALQHLHDDFTLLRKQVRDGNKLRVLISSFTIKLVDKRNFARLEEIFLLEKQLDEVLERQELELRHLLNQASKMRSLPEEERLATFMDSLYKIRKILAGHLEHHNLWEEEREGFSNASNIILSLIKAVEHCEL